MQLYPRMARYLAMLPEAEASYAECRIRAGLVKLSLEYQPFPIEDQTPAWLVDFLQEKRTATSLLPLVHCNAWILAMVDSVFGGDEQRYLEFNYEVNRRFGDHPMYSLLYKMLSPGFIMRTLPMSFQQLMPGVKPVLRAHEDAGILVLRYPENLYTELLARGWAEAVRAMVENAGGKNPVVKLHDFGKTQLQISARWE